MTTSGPAFEAMNGELELAPGQSYGDVRALFAMYPTPFQMVALADSGIEYVAGDALAVADVLGQILPEHLAHLRLVTPEIVMARPAAHEKINHPLGLGRKVRAARLASGVGEQIRANDVC